MVTQVGSFILVYVECKVAIPMVSTRKTDDDHHVADSEAIGRLRHELIKSTGNPQISSGVKLKFDIVIVQISVNEILFEETL